MSRSLFVALVLLLGLGPSGAAQQSAPGQASPQPAAGPPLAVNVGGFSGDYQIGPGDMLEVQVIGHEDLRQNLRVSNSGDIDPSMLSSVRVLDMTTFEVEDTIERLLREADLVRQAEVLVAVREFRAKPISVTGAVTVPGEYIMSETLTVVDAILMANGLRFDAGDEALVHRRVSPNAVWSPAAIAAQPGQAGPGIEVIKVDLKPMKQGRFSVSTPSLKRGDVVVVREQLMSAFFVVGDVTEPRNFYYSAEQEIMVSQAISMAGGPTLTAKMSQGMLVRYDEAGSRVEKQVDYAAILSGRQPDFAIRPNDIIFIPGSAIKSVAQGMVRMTGSALMNTAFRIGRTYQMPDAPDRPPSSPQQ